MKQTDNSSHLSHLSHPSHPSHPGDPGPNEDFIQSVMAELRAQHPDAEPGSIERGVSAVARFWREQDGDEAAFRSLCLEHFVSDPAEHARLVGRLETALSVVSGHLSEIRRNLRRWSDLQGDDFEGVDDVLALFNPAPDLNEQLFRQKLAFIALLNGAEHSLDQMLDAGSDWDDAGWVWARVGRSFGDRVPEPVLRAARETRHAASTWVDTFKVPVGKLVDASGHTWFDADRTLIAHWHVRDRIKAVYGDADGLPRQRALAAVMRRHIEGTIPRSVMDGSFAGTAWDPEANTLDGEAVAEADTIGLVRYEKWLSQFHVAQTIDEHSPSQPTALARRFQLQREIPEQEVERLLVDMLASPVRGQAYAVVREQLGRPLEAHDIYYQNLAPEASSEELDRRVRERFGTIDGLKQKLPDILLELGYTPDDAQFLADNIRVEICKGAGHAVPPGRPEYASWMRTSSLADELGWDGFDTAMHELGHNIEQVISCHFAPRPILRGVPNTACTEAFAFLYQSQARRVLGLPDFGDAQLETVQRLIEACEIAGPALLEIRVWRWLYEHPDADAAALRDEVLRLAGALWAEFYEPYFGPDKYRLLAAYQHMIAYPLYLADYALGYMINHQITAHMAGKDLAAETKRICAIGRVTPDLWMRRAVGSPISAAALLDAVAAG